MALQALAKDKEVLELGSYCGRSTICMAMVASKVVAVDHHQGDAFAGNEHTLDEFLTNLDRFDVKSKVCPITLPIPLAGRMLVGTNQQFDMAFVDSAHDRASVERDTRLALALVKPGGIIAWHDWNWGAASVEEGVTACGLKPLCFTGSLAWLQLPPPS